jgi:hypothetical protein
VLSHEVALVDAKPDCRPHKGIGTDIRTGVRSLRTDQTFLTRGITMKVRGFNNTDIRQQQDQARNDKKVVEVLSHWANGIGSPDKLSTFTQAAHP